MRVKTTQLFTAIVMACTGSLSAQLLTPEVLYYKFDGTGTSVPNLASSPPPGTTTATIMGGLTQGGNSICQGTIIGSGNASSTDYVNTGWAPNLGASSWTISFRTENITPSSTLFYIFGDANTASFRCFTNGVAGPNNWILRGAGLTDIYINGGATVAPHMSTFVYDASMNQVRGYLDGVLVTTVAQGAVNMTGTGPLKVIGYGTNVGMPANGHLDEYRFYSRALTQMEITQLYNPYTPSGFLGADTALCTSGQVQLDITWPYQDIVWSTGATTSGITATSPGTYSVDITGNCGTGSDTIVIGDLRTYATISPVACGTVYSAPSGAQYFSSGTYMDTIPNVGGCDSLITINLSLNAPTSSSVTATACDMYTAPSGAMYMASGTYMDTIANVVGCDSVITINLTINMASSSTMSVTACDSMYMAPSGAMYTTAGTYMDTIANMTGCDSVITINLTFNTPTSSTVSVTECDSVYMAPSGAMYTTAGTYMDTIANMMGCDSVITINLAFGASSSASVAATICSGATYVAPSGATYTAAGTYTDMIPNMAGCDSIITINLAVTTVNTAFSDNGTGLCTAAASGATYQWATCTPNFAIIPGATSQTYQATVSGSYAVIVTENSCTDTSACQTVIISGVEENALAQQVVLFPNPTTGNFTIDLGTTYSTVVVTVTDIAGRVVSVTRENATAKLQLNIEEPQGIYFVTIKANDQQAVLRLIKN